MQECGTVEGREIDRIQHVTQPPDAQKNFLVVDNKTETSAIEAAFDRFTQERKDIAILLINQHVRRQVATPIQPLCRLCHDCSRGEPERALADMHSRSQRR